MQRYWLPFADAELSFKDKAADDVDEDVDNDGSPPSSLSVELLYLLLMMVSWRDTGSTLRLGRDIIFDFLCRSNLTDIWFVVFFQWRK